MHTSSGLQGKAEISPWHMSFPQLLPHDSQSSFPEAKALGAASAPCSVADHIKHEEQPGLLPNTVTKRRFYSSWDLLVALSFKMPDWDTGREVVLGPLNSSKHQERDCLGHETLVCARGFAS